MSNFPCITVCKHQFDLKQYFDPGFVTTALILGMPAAGGTALQGLHLAVID